MSGYTQTNEEVVFSGPESPYPAAGASSTAQNFAMVGASGDFQQPKIYGDFFKPGRRDQCLAWEFAALVNGQAAATTLIIALGLVTSPNTISGMVTLLTFPAVTVTSFANGSIVASGNIRCTGVGYGTTATSTNLRTYGSLVGSGNNTSVQAAAGPTVTNNIDATLTQWLAVAVTFSTSAAGNNITLGDFILEGMN